MRSWAQFGTSGGRRAEDAPRTRGPSARRVDSDHQIRGAVRVDKGHAACGRLSRDPDSDGSLSVMVVARLGVLLALLSLLPADSGLAPSPVELASRKPTAPVVLELLATPVGATSVELAYTLRPLVDAAWVTVVAELPHGGRLLAHTSAETSALRAGESRSGRALVELPEAVRAGLHAAELRLEASVGLRQIDGSVERVTTVARTRVGSGELPIDARAVRSGSLQTWDVSARHEAGAR